MAWRYAGASTMRGAGNNMPSDWGRWNAMGGLLALILATFGCTDVEPVLPTPSRAQFAESVYPVLLRDCSFHACHGDANRPFQIFGPGRRRLPGPEGEVTFPVDGPLQAELDASYERARSMLLYRGDIEMAPLLRKIRPGGAHEGVGRWGRNVYRSVDDTGYQILLAWARDEAWVEEEDAASEESD